MAFLIIEKDGELLAYRLNQRVTSIGRALDNSFSIDDAKSSRHHCELVRQEDDSYILHDPGSRNGTLVNAQLTRHHVMADGDRIEIGQTAFSFRLTDEGMAAHTSHLAAMQTAKLPDDNPETIRTHSFDLPDELPEAHIQIRRLAECVEISKRVASVLELDSLLTEILDAAIELSGGERGFLLTLDGGTMEVALARDANGQTLDNDPLAAISHSLCMRAIKTCRPVLTHNAQGDDRFKESASISELRLRSVLCLPLLFQTEILGALYLDHPVAKGVFSERDVALLETFASHAAISFHNARLHRQIQTHLAERTQQLEVLRQELQTRYDYRRIVGRSSAMQEVFRILDKIVPINVPVLIQGESGTGKELIARAIHFNGTRKEGPFVSLNCAAINDALLESELFGHEKGAFTGAEETKKGLFELASGGTILLDEVGEMSQAMQARLLRALQESEIRRVGGKESIHIDVRVVSATNADLPERVEGGEFRADLYYRLNGVTIEPPPLRHRREDIPLLVESFLKKIAEEGEQEIPWPTPEALRKLCAYHWPGNVRELENEIKRAVAMTEKENLQPDDLLISSRSETRGHSLFDTLDGTTLKERVECLERHLIQEALERHEGNKTKTAEALGLSRPGLRKKIARYQITPP